MVSGLEVCRQCDRVLVLYLLAGQAVNVQENVAMLVGMCLYTGLNYLGQRFFAFKEK